MAIRPDLFRFEECDVRVGLEEGDLARTFPERCGGGGACIAAEVDVAAAEREMVRRLTAGGA
jgi:hypothetical protein